MSEMLIKRVKSLLWRAGMMAIATFLAVMSENIGLLELPMEATVILGLLLGEISKALNTRS